MSLQPYKLKKQTNTSQRNLFPLKETFSLCILKSIISEPTQAGPSQPSITFRGEIEQPVRGLPHPPPQQEHDPQHMGGVQLNFFPL